MDDGERGGAHSAARLVRATEVIVTTLADFDLPTTLEWPPVQRALAEGRMPRLRRRGWRIFWAWRREQAALLPLPDEPLDDNDEAFIQFLVTEAIRRCETSRD